MRQFAEEELIVSTGPAAGRRYRVDRQPWNRLWFDAIDSGRYRRFVNTGAGQGGKTWCGSVTPVMYHTCEEAETVVYGVPDLAMVDDKWQQDLLPAFLNSRYRDLLPRTGEGSRGGTVRTKVDLLNGASIRFMTGGAGDKGRAGFTARIVVITEVDGLDNAGTHSDETDKVSQLEARSNVYEDRARIYLECTVSTEKGRIWQEYLQGTRSRIAMRCPHCRAFVTPEREHLIGWQDAADVMEAKDRGRIHCPACGAAWDETDRREANLDAQLVHKDQEVLPDGSIAGEAPRTDTLGFRWTAANNLFVKMGVIAQQEYRAARAGDPELAERALTQFRWTIPSKPKVNDLTALDAEIIVRRTTQDPKGLLPAGTRRVTVAVDVGKWLCHWVALGWVQPGTPHEVEYGRFDVPSKEMAPELAILVALRQFRDEVLSRGWAHPDGGQRVHEMCFVDSGYMTGAVYEFVRESGKTYLPSKGYGSSQGTLGPYRAKKSTGAEVVINNVADRYHVVRLSPEQGGGFLVEADADHWKQRVHDSLSIPPANPGALTFHAATEPHEHLAYAKHLLSERREEQMTPRGMVSRFRAVSRNNHWLDSTWMAICAARGLGEVLLGSTPAAADDSTEPEPEQGVNPLTDFRGRY